MQKPFAGLLSDVLWYVHALDPIGVQKSDTTSLNPIKKIAAALPRNPTMSAAQIPLKEMPETKTALAALALHCALEHFFRQYTIVF